MYLIECTSKHGIFYIPGETPGCVVCQNIRQGHIYDEGVYKWVARHIGKNSTVIDVGALFGQMTVLFSRLAGQVHTIEANQEMIPIIEKNLIENGCHNVTVHHRAAWDKNDQRLYFQTQAVNSLPANCSTFSFGSLGIDPTATSGEWVNSITIDSLDLEDVSAIKIDVQGADLHVLRGARETIRRCRPAIAFEVEVYNVPQFGQCRADALKLVEELGYEVVEEPGLANYFILPKTRS